MVICLSLLMYVVKYSVFFFVINTGEKAAFGQLIPDEF